MQGYFSLRAEGLSKVIDGVVIAADPSVWNMGPTLRRSNIEGTSAERAGVF
jgi:hypothetical protein